MAREQAWPPTEHSSSDPAPFVTTQADIVPSVASGGNVNVMLSTLEESSSQVLDPTYQSSVGYCEQNDYDRAWRWTAPVWCHSVDCI